MENKLREKLPDELGKSDAEEELNALAEEIKFHDLRYYNDSNPIVDDFYYDGLRRRFETIAQRFPQL